MKLIVLLCILTANLFSANILSFKVYDRSDRTDLLLTFDTPYNGRISQKNSLNKTTLLLYDAYYSQQVQKNIQSNFINTFSIVPQNDRTALVLSLNKETDFKVSKTVDNYGLRLRFAKKAIASATNKTPSSFESPQANTLPTKNTTVGNSRYIIVVLILLIAVLLLFFIKRKVDNSKNGGGWLFKNQPQAGQQFNILFQKPIDNVNKVVLMEVNDRQYLVVLGSSHLLLDTFADKKNINQDGFESILKENEQELNNYIQIDRNEAKDPLQSYKEKASLEAYRSHM